MSRPHWLVAVCTVRWWSIIIGINVLVIGLLTTLSPGSYKLHRLLHLDVEPENHGGWTIKIFLLDNCIILGLGYCVYEKTKGVIVMINVPETKTITGYINCNFQIMSFFCIFFCYLLFSEYEDFCIVKRVN